MHRAISLLAPSILVARHVADDCLLQQSVGAGEPVRLRGSVIHCTYRCCARALNSPVSTPPSKGDHGLHRRGLRSESHRVFSRYDLTFRTFIGCGQRCSLPATRDARAGDRNGELRNDSIEGRDLLSVLARQPGRAGRHATACRPHRRRPADRGWRLHRPLGGDPGQGSRPRPRRDADRGRQGGLRRLRPSGGHRLDIDHARAAQRREAVPERHRRARAARTGEHARSP